jgi:hypothetical protein
MKRLLRFNKMLGPNLVSLSSLQQSFRAFTRAVPGVGSRDIAGCAKALADRFVYHHFPASCAQRFGPSYLQGLSST